MYTLYMVKNKSNKSQSHCKKKRKRPTYTLKTDIWVDSRCMCISATEIRVRQLPKYRCVGFVDLYVGSRRTHIYTSITDNYMESSIP